MKNYILRKEVDHNTSTVNVLDRQLSKGIIMQLRHIEGIVTELHGLKKNSFTPYEASQIVNDAFGIAMRPQMMYNYVKKGYITATFGPEGWRISKNELIRWTTKYVLKNLLTLE